MLAFAAYGEGFLFFMRIDIHFHDDENEKLLKQILNNQIKIMASLKDIQDQNTALIAAVADEDTVIDGATTAVTGFATILQGLKDQLAAAIANGLDPAAAQAVVDAMGNTITDINTKKQALADAVATIPTA